MREKILPVFLYALLVLIGFGLGFGTTKLNVSKKTPESNSSFLTDLTEPTQLSKKEEKSTEKNDYQTYVVQPGDTLFGISTKLNVSMDELASLNGITDVNQIKVGQTLKIPGTKTATSGQIQIDLARMKELQDLVNQGNQPWRLDPVEVVKADAPASYQFSALDTYNLKSKDDVTGDAVVEVIKTKDSKTYIYEVSLIQPIEKGPKGIWAISSITEKVQGQ